MIIRLFERSPIPMDDWHTIRNRLLVVHGKLLQCCKRGDLPSKDSDFIRDRLREAEIIILKNVKRGRKGNASGNPNPKA